MQINNSLSRLSKKEKSSTTRLTISEIVLDEKGKIFFKTMRKQKLNASYFEVVLLCLFLKHKIHVP